MGNLIVANEVTELCRRGAKPRVVTRERMNPMQPTVRKLKAGAAQLHCLVTAPPGASSAVIFLHAGVADSRMFAEQMAAISSDYLAVAFDRRGFGQTLTADEPYSQVDDLATVIESIEPTGLILVGCSQGARIAIDYTLENPARVQALVLIGATYSGAPEPELDDRTAALDAQIEAAEASGNLDEVNRLEAHLWLDGPNSPEGRVSGALRELFLDMNATALRAPELRGEREPPSAAARLAQIRCPVLLLEGDLDVSFVHDQHDQLAGAFADCSRVVFSGTAHLPTLEKPGAFNELLAGFLDQVG